MDAENPVFRSLDIIERRITEKLTIENIAGGVYFSKYHYSRLFRDIVGGSVMEYVTRRKLSLAGRALLETGATILDVALDYGYESREGFMRSFKAYMGVTPTEYRRYGLSAISQKIIKERNNMTYSNTTDEIIRELNDFIAKAKEAADTARKTGASESLPQPFTGWFWEGIAEQTDRLADNLKDMLHRINAINERPDGITNRFTILKAVEDAAFMSNIMSFHTGATIARSLPEFIDIQKPLCERYNELARVSGVKAGKVAMFLNELAALIFDDMRKNVREKLQAAAGSGHAAADDITGYAYIKNEISAMSSELSSTPPEKINASRLDDFLVMLDIIQFSVDTDILRSGGADKDMFAGLAVFRESLREAYEFMQSLPKPEAACDAPAAAVTQSAEGSPACDMPAAVTQSAEGSPACDAPDAASPATTAPPATPASPAFADSPAAASRSISKYFSDVVYQGNIMLFYTRGEVEKMSGARTNSGGILDDAQKASLDKLCDKINAFIQYARGTTGSPSYNHAIELLNIIVADTVEIADGLKQHGGVIRYIADEFRRLSDSLQQHAG